MRDYSKNSKVKRACSFINNILSSSLNPDDDLSKDCERLDISRYDEAIVCNRPVNDEQSIAFYLSNSRSSIRSECDTVEFIDVATGSISATNYDQSKYNYKLPFRSVNDIAISSTNSYRDKNSLRYKYNTF